MSEAQKPVEEPVVAPAAPVESTPAPVAEESKPVEAAEPTAETPVVAAEPATEEATPVKEEVKPVEEGILGYKGPGLIKSFIFQKRFFWYGSDAVEAKHLSSYLRGEKPEVANHNAAWASSTGKGLLFFTKKASEKASPSHVFNLSEVTDITEDGTTDFTFVQGGHKYTFQASTIAERDNWVSTLKVKSTEAKELVDTVKESEEYKKTHSSLAKPIIAAAAVLPKKSTEVKKEEVKEEKKEEKAEAKEEKKEEKKEVKEEKAEKATRKSRSASRKRTSIFGSIPGFGEKKEKTPVKEEETPVVEGEPTPTETPAPVEVAPIADTPEVVAPVEAVAPATETRPTPNKRASIFDQFKSFTHKEKKPEAESAPAVPAKDAEPVSETAPVIPAVESTEPLATSVASPATVPTETTEVPATNGEVKEEAAAVPTKSDKRKSSLPWLSKKEKPTSDEEGDVKKPTSPFAKLRATVKGKKEKAPVVEKKEEPAAEEAAKEEEATAPAVVEPVNDEPTPVAATTPQVTATA